jgi:hypothetical protein
VSTVLNVVYFLLIEHADGEGIAKVDEMLAAPLDGYEAAHDRKTLDALNAMFFA